MWNVLNQSDEKLTFRLFQFLVLKLSIEKELPIQVQKKNVFPEVAKLTGKMQIDRTKIY